jgi:hypothetical protein
VGQDDGALFWMRKAIRPQWFVLDWRLIHQGRSSFATSHPGLNARFMVFTTPSDSTMVHTGM